jgi:hypothetical protein
MKTQSKKPCYRHGEINLLPIEKLPDGLKLSDTKTVMQGSHKNSHLIDYGELYFKNVDQYIFGYLVAKNTHLLHFEHGNICSVCGFDKLGKEPICPKCQTNFVVEKKYRKAKLPNGVMELRKQLEHINNELKPVID